MVVVKVKVVGVWQKEGGGGSVAGVLVTGVVEVIGEGDELVVGRGGGTGGDGTVEVVVEMVRQ